MLRSLRPHKPPPADLRIPIRPTVAPRLPPLNKKRRLKVKPQPPWYALLSEVIYLRMSHIFPRFITWYQAPGYSILCGRAMG